jgi:hypothetical protein
LAEEFEGKIAFIGVSNNDSVAAGKDYVETFDVPYPMAHAPEVWDLFDFPYRPTTIVIDAEGRIASRTDGEISYDVLKKHIEAVL